MLLEKTNRRTKGKKRKSRKPKRKQKFRMTITEDGPPIAKIKLWYELILSRLLWPVEHDSSTYYPTFSEGDWDRNLRGKFAVCESRFKKLSQLPRLGEKISAKASSWEEYFLGTITSVNNDGTYDIKFDEKVMRVTPNNTGGDKRTAVKSTQIRSNKECARFDRSKHFACQDCQGLPPSTSPWKKLYRSRESIKEGAFSTEKEIATLRELIRDCALATVSQMYYKGWPEVTPENFHFSSEWLMEKVTTFQPSRPSEQNWPIIGAAPWQSKRPKGTGMFYAFAALLIAMKTFMETDLFDWGDFDVRNKGGVLLENFDEFFDPKTTRSQGLKDLRLIEKKILKMVDFTPCREYQQSVGHLPSRWQEDSLDKAFWGGRTTRPENIFAGGGISPLDVQGELPYGGWKVPPYLRLPYRREEKPSSSALLKARAKSAVAKRFAEIDLGTAVTPIKKSSFRMTKREVNKKLEKLLIKPCSKCKKYMSEKYCGACGRAVRRADMLPQEVFFGPKERRQQSEEITPEEITPEEITPEEIALALRLKSKDVVLERRRRPVNIPYKPPFPESTSDWPEPYKLTRKTGGSKTSSRRRPTIRVVARIVSGPSKPGVKVKAVRAKKTSFRMKKSRRRRRSRKVKRTRFKMSRATALATGQYWGPGLSRGTPVKGERILGNWDDMLWSLGIITSVNNDGTYNIHYDDGDIEENVALSHLKEPDLTRYSGGAVRRRRTPFKRFSFVASRWSAVRRTGGTLHNLSPKRGSICKKTSSPQSPPYGGVLRPYLQPNLSRSNQKAYLNGSWARTSRFVSPRD